MLPTYRALHLCRSRGQGGFIFLKGNYLCFTASQDALEKSLQNTEYYLLGRYMSQYEDIRDKNKTGLLNLCWAIRMQPAVKSENRSYVITTPEGSSDNPGSDI